MLNTIRRLIERLSLIGVTPDDTDDVRAQKVTLTLAAVIVTLLAVVWVGTYLALGLPVSAAIPFAYQVASVVTLVVFARTKDYRFFRASQIVLILLLPFLLQLSLGGYVASSAVSLWALVARFGALFFYSAREAVPWFVVFVGLTVRGRAPRTRLASEHPAAIPVPIQTAFFVLNILGVSPSPPTSCSSTRSGRATPRSRAPTACSSTSCRGRSPSASSATTGVIAEALRGGHGAVRRRRRLHALRRAHVARSASSASSTRSSAPSTTSRERHGLEKIKTIGDAYMVVAGLPEPRADHAEAMAEHGPRDAGGAPPRLCATAGPRPGDPRSAWRAGP